MLTELKDVSQEMMKKGIKPKVQPLVPLKTTQRRNRDTSFMNTSEFMAQTSAFRSRMPGLEPKTGARIHDAEPRILDFSDFSEKQNNNMMYVVVGVLALGLFLLNKES